MNYCMLACMHACMHTLIALQILLSPGHTFEASRVENQKFTMSGDVSKAPNSLLPLLTWEDEGDASTKAIDDEEVKVVLADVAIEFKGAMASLRILMHMMHASHRISRACDADSYAGMADPNHPELNRGIAFRRFRSRLCAKDEALALLQGDGNWGSACLCTRLSLTSMRPVPARACACLRSL